MAKKENEVAIIHQNYGVDVWVDDAPSWVKKIRDIEGVIDVDVFGEINLIVDTDPRYDISELVSEIKNLLR